MAETTAEKSGRKGKSGFGRPRILTHERIVAAAVQVLDEEGFQALSARALALRLGVNHATLYNYVSCIEDVETEALASLRAAVPMPSADDPTPMREQLVKHLIAVYELQLRHPHVLHAPIASATWQSHITQSNRVLRALQPYCNSLLKLSLAYSTLIAAVASRAERARVNGASDYSDIQRRGLQQIPLAESDLIRQVIESENEAGINVNSLPAILNALIDLLLPDIDLKPDSVKPL